MLVCQNVNFITLQPDCIVVCILLPQDPAIARAALEVTAREGLPVKGTNAKTWEDLRPKIVHDTRPAKVRLCFVTGCAVSSSPADTRWGTYRRADQGDPSTLLPGHHAPGIVAIVQQVKVLAPSKCAGLKLSGEWAMDNTSDCMVEVSFRKSLIAVCCCCCCCRLVASWSTTVPHWATGLLMSA